MKSPPLGRREFAAVVFGIAAAVSPVACKGLGGKPKPVLRLVYQVDPATGDSAARAQAAVKVGDTFQRRLGQLRISGSTVEVRDDRVAVGLPPLDTTQLADVKSILSFRGKLEFRRVDDEDDHVGKSALAWGGRQAEAGVEVKPETVMIGPGRTANTHYASVAKRPGESLSQARSRLEALVKQVPPPPDREVGFGELQEWDSPAPGEAAGAGWRTYLLFAQAELSNEHLAQADAVKSEGVGGQWTVGIRFTAAGARAFEQLTEKNTKRRLAIMLDGRVESAPLIQEPIRGGRAMITMGKASPETEEKEARRLELVLRSGALAASIVLVAEEMIPAK